eukprot:SAG11_NODE_100_length_16863_cov_12.374911_15_plen_511_part_00
MALAASTVMPPKAKRAIPRQGMYGMLAVQQFCNYVTRGSLAPLIQFIVADLSLSQAQKGLLLAAFFPVFTPAQVLAGPLCQMFGAKRLLALNLGGMSTSLLLLPTLARLGGTWAICACLAGIGVCQSVLVPAQGQLKRNWLTDGPERVWALRIIGLGMRVGYPAAASVTPWLANRAGWRAVPYCYGAPMACFAMLWHFFAAESPAPVADPPKSAVAAAASLSESGGALKYDVADDVADKAAARKAEIEKKTMEWGIFRVPAVLSAVAAHVSSNNLGYTFLHFTPTYYNEALHLSDVAAGPCAYYYPPPPPPPSLSLSLLVLQEEDTTARLLTLCLLLHPSDISFPGTVGIWGPFLLGALENKLRAAGMPLLKIRRRFTLWGSILQALSCLIFTRMRTPALAMLANTGVHVGMCLHSSGWSANYLEVGGKDTALMYSVGNALASIPGLMLPPLGFWLLRRTNSWLPLFGFSAGCTMLAGLWFNASASLTTGRELLAQKRERAAAPKNTKTA